MVIVFWRLESPKTRHLCDDCQYNFSPCMRFSKWLNQASEHLSNHSNPPPLSSDKYPPSDLAMKPKKFLGMVKSLPYACQIVGRYASREDRVILDGGRSKRLLRVNIAPLKFPHLS